jgi:hypothetical protein
MTTESADAGSAITDTGLVTRDVMLAYPHPGWVRGEFMNRVASILQDEKGRVGEVADLMSGPGIAMSRNRLANRFLEGDSEWLWFCDTDMVVSLETLPALLAAADPDQRPVVGAFCCVMVDSEIRPSMYLSSRDDEGMFAFRHLVEWPDDTLLRVDATGCGCLLIHRSVFARLAALEQVIDGLWFTEMVVDNHQLGEDLSFCIRLSWAEIPVFVHTGVQVGHMKAVQLGKCIP